MLNNNEKSPKELLASYSSFLHEAGKTQSVLVAEDDEIANTLAVTFLKKFYYRVDSATDGLRALNLYKKHQYDIVVTDISMPQLNGIDLCKQIRRVSATQKIILMTAHNEQEYLLEAIRTGASDYIIKPLDFNNLLNALYKVSMAINDEKSFREFNDKLPSSVKILIVDDSELARDGLKSIVEKCIDNASILMAENGQHALEVLKNNGDISIIFIDWYMPIMDGYEFAKQIRNNKDYNHIKLVLATSELNKNKITQAFQLGLNGYIPKPFNPNIVNKMILKII